jgi:hypothetical protein
MEERRAVSAEAQAFESALRRVLADDELVRAFWHRGYAELTAHAGNGASQWIGKRILTAMVVSVVTAGLVWLIKTGSLK